MKYLSQYFSKNLKKTFSLIAVFVTFVFMSSVTHAQTCKSMSEESCESTDRCSWIAAYERKDGRKVNAFCRNKPGAKKAAEKTKKPTKTKTG